MTLGTLSLAALYFAILKRAKVPFLASMFAETTSALAGNSVGALRPRLAGSIVWTRREMMRFKLVLAALLAAVPALLLAQGLSIEGKYVSPAESLVIERVGTSDQYRVTATLKDAS